MNSDQLFGTRVEEHRLRQREDGLLFDLYIVSGKRGSLAFMSFV